MADEEQPKFHPVVELMLRRMESFPDEFKLGVSRWVNVVEDIQEYGTDEEIAALKQARARIIMNEIHERAMDELCNGEARREEERRKRMDAVLKVQSVNAGIQPLPLKVGAANAMNAIGNLNSPYQSAMQQNAHIEHEMQELLAKRQLDTLKAYQEVVQEHKTKKKGWLK